MIYERLMAMSIPFHPPRPGSWESRYPVDDGVLAAECFVTLPSTNNLDDPPAKPKPKRGRPRKKAD